MIFFQQLHITFPDKQVSPLDASPLAQDPHLFHRECTWWCIHESIAVPPLLLNREGGPLSADRFWLLDFDMIPAMCDGDVQVMTPVVSTKACRFDPTKWGFAKWIHEDDLPDDYPHDAMFAKSRVVNGFRLFPEVQP